MGILVAGIGFLVVALATGVMISPALLKRILQWLVSERKFHLVAGLRIIFGVVLIVAAPATQLPTFIFVVGVLLILSAISIELLGYGRISRFAEWWMLRPDLFLRAWAAIAITFGMLIIWAAM